MFGKPKAECGQPSAKKLGCEEADNHCEEANTFNEGTDDDHWGLDLADSLWLTRISSAAVAELLMKLERK